ncbi:MAG: hypothetical protein KH194_02465 [Clostridiales bacterium]|nr:hypothetical protein [Clostridiales bacterium]
MKWIALADPIRVEPWDILSHPGCFLRRKKAAVFIFPFFGGGENRRWLCRGFAIHQSDFIGQEYAVTRLLAIIRFSLAAPLGSSTSIHQ